MENNLPLGFSFALAQNPEAMKAFSSFPEKKQTEIRTAPKATFPNWKCKSW